MAIETSVPSPVFGPTGFVIPPTSLILTGVLTDTDAAYGGGMNLALNTPQGQRASSLTAIIDNGNSVFLKYTNLVDPALSSGRMQDAIGYIYFIVRIPAQATVVAATCTGKPGVPIPFGSLAQDANGNLYSSLANAVIGGGGTVDIEFACTVKGPIVCPTGALNTIYQAIPGWDTITNAAAGAVGQNVESPAQFELRRSQSVAQNSMGPAPAVQGAVLSVPGVLDAYTFDNDTASPVTFQGQTIAAKSLYCCVEGGDAQAVAQAIWTRKAPGCAYTGNTTETVEDANSGYSSPLPSYSVTFQRPTNLNIFYLVTLKSSPATPANAQTQVQGAVLETFSGTQTDPNFNSFNTRARIGGTIFTSDYVPNIALLGGWARVVSIGIGSLNSPAASFTGAISGDTLTVSGAVTGALAIGQALTDSAGHILPGTIITALGSGTGGDGTYTLNQSQTVTSQAMDTIAMTLADLTVNINQFPVLAAPNVFLALV